MNTAMILAAGRGERLKPLTNTVPKAMCRVNNIPLIEHHVINLAKSGFSHLVINHAHLGGQIRNHFGNGSKWGVELDYSPEPPGGLETGGGILNALPLLGDLPFLTVNADIYTDFDFKTLHLPMDSSVHLVLGKNPEHNFKGDFGLNNHQTLTNEGIYTFLGISVYHPAIFKRQHPGRYSVVPMIRLLAEQQRASGEVFTGEWVDIGTVERLSYVNRKFA